MNFWTPNCTDYLSCHSVCAVAKVKYLSVNRIDLCCKCATLILVNLTATVHARLDRKTKEASETVLREIGMTPTEAIRLFYRQIAMRHEFPLELRVPNAHTAKVLDQSDRNEEVEYFDSADDLKKSWAR